MTPVRLLKNFSDLKFYSFWKVCHPVRLLETVTSLETLEYTVGIVKNRCLFIKQAFLNKKVDRLPQYKASKAIKGIKAVKAVKAIKAVRLSRRSRLSSLRLTQHQASKSIKGIKAFKAVKAVNAIKAIKVIKAIKAIKAQWAENRGQGVLGVFVNRFGSNFHQPPNF